MPPRDPNLPEGTDSIIDDDAGFGGSSVGVSGSTRGDSDYGMSDEVGGTGSMSGIGSSSEAGYGDVADTAALGGSSSGSSTSKAVGEVADQASKLAGSADVQSLKSQATDKVRDVATQGKDRATEALDSVSRLVSDTADTVDDRLGPQYGDYVRRAAGALDGLNESIRTKEVDELFDDARELVRKSPAVAIGAAAAIGFLLVRLVKSGMPQSIDQDDYYTGGTSKSFGSAPRVDNSYDPVA